MIVTIDGPAGAGKSTVARCLAEAIKFEFLDTGAMYRAMTYAAMTADIPLDDPEALLEACRTAPLEFALDGIRLDGRDISVEIRLPEVSRNVKFVADHPQIRELLVARQRELAAQKDIVCEGRDQGTVAFPDAECKFFLTASAEERARRRVRELESRQVPADFDSIKRDQDLRDQQDRSRPVGALKQAPDAEVIQTDGRSIAEVVEQLKERVHSWIAHRSTEG